MSKTVKSKGSDSGRKSHTDEEEPPSTKTVYPMHYYKPGPISLTEFPYPYPDGSGSSAQHLAHAITQMQLYEPLYNVFFELNDLNYATVALNHQYHAISADKVVNMLNQEICSRPVFIKFSPLLDPIKYMVGKYDMNDTTLKTLPTFRSTKTECHPKILNPMNASYVDAFFCYLSSVLKNHHQFVHGIDYYGSYLGIQDKFRMNVEEDLSYLSGSPFFMANLGKLMVLENHKGRALPLTHASSRAARTKVVIDHEQRMGLEDLGMVQVLDEETPAETDPLPEAESPMDLVYHKTRSDPQESSWHVSEAPPDAAVSTDPTEEDGGNDSDTDTEEYYQEGLDIDSSNHEEEPRSESQEGADDQEYEDDADDDQEYEDDWETESDIGTEEDDVATEDEAMVFIYDFPVQLILLEKCSHTLDHLLIQGLPDDEICSALFQVIMILLTYQRMFRFTHNDLHTNNIMYVKTDAPLLYYTYQGRRYALPTYGRIFKIIDYGRSIYKYQKRVFCSDSFSSDGDAASQYNTEPYLKSSKPRLDPNMSFDLSRLGCSIYDFVFEDNDVVANEKMAQTELQRTIQRWCTDDQGRNVLYKKNGEERYPGFRLYKMIARTVKAHTPEAQLNDPWFSRFRVTDPAAVWDEHAAMHMNLDVYPEYV